MTQTKQSHCTKVCPTCGSAELFYEKGEVMGAIYHCKHCDYIGTLVVEANEELIKELRQNYEKKGKQIENYD